MITKILLALGIVFISILLLGIRVFFSKKGSFPNTHIGKNKHMKEKGIHCAQSQDLEEQRRKNIFDLPSFN
jgi:hypothetical protein